MPIDFFTASDGLHIRQSFESPTVYLDHWAVRLLSDDLDHQNRFVNALKSKGGTLVISNFSLLEFSGASDPRHCIDTERFFDRLLPNIYFTDFAFDKTHERELAEPNNEKRFWPPADLPALKYFVERLDNDAENLTMSGFLSLYNERQTEFLELKNKTISMVRDALDSHRSDTSYVAKSRNILPSNERTRTYIILGELIRGFNLDPNSKIRDNDIIDLIHAISPLNCCDYILLDGPWEERVKKMNNRISKTLINMPIAKCFSKRDNGVELFLSSLESFDKSEHLTAIAHP